MKKLLENATVRLISYDKSPIAKLFVSKAPKALLALAITTGSTALATGIVPLNVNVAGREISNVEEAQAWWQHVAYKAGSLNSRDLINFCRRNGRRGLASSDTWSVACYENSGSRQSHGLSTTRYSKNLVCDTKYGFKRHWIASNGRDCWDGYYKWR